MKVIMMKGLRCERCGHQWVPRDLNEVKVCPKCKSPYWDRPRRRTKKAVAHE